VLSAVELAQAWASLESVVGSSGQWRQRDLALAYTPGVAVPCLEIAKNPADVYKYTNKGNLVAVITKFNNFALVWSLTEGGDEVVAVLLSGKVSGTYNAALMAAQSVGGERIEVIDSLSASMALGFLALEGASKAAAGADRRAVADHVRSLVPKAKILCAIDTLTYLERGGRIGKARALVGSLLNFKPLITLRDGEVVPLGRARGRPQMLDRLGEMLRRDGPVTRMAVLHGAAEAEADHLRTRIAPEYPEVDVIVTEIGPVLGTHTGPGVIGITYLTA